jgi:hypothetical protein
MLKNKENLEVALSHRVAPKITDAPRGARRHPGAVRDAVGLMSTPSLPAAIPPRHPDGLAVMSTRRKLMLEKVVGERR